MAAAAVMLAGTAINVYGQMKAANDRADAEAKSAELKRIESKEILDRASVNASIINQDELQTVSNQMGGYAVGNIDIGHGSPLITLEATHAHYQTQLANMKREAQFRANQDIQSANSSDYLAGQERQSATIGAIGSVITSGAAAYNIATPNSKK